MRYAVIKAGQVVNVITAAPGFALEGFDLVASDVAGPGWTYVDGVFSAPAEPAPDPQQIEAARAAAYRETSDGLFFKWQAGEASETDWRAARAAVKAQFPDP